jgi:hypothetical protein
MATCKDCKFYTPVDDLTGNCFGHTVSCNMPVDKCPAKSFTPKK